MLVQLSSLSISISFHLYSPQPSQEDRPEDNGDSCPKTQRISTVLLVAQCLSLNLFVVFKHFFIRFHLYHNCIVSCLPSSVTYSTHPSWGQEDAAIKMPIHAWWQHIGTCPTGNNNSSKTTAIRPSQVYIFMTAYLYICIGIVLESPSQVPPSQVSASRSASSASSASRGPSEVVRDRGSQSISSSHSFLNKTIEINRNYHF